MGTGAPVNDYAVEVALTVAAASAAAAATAAQTALTDINTALHTLANGTEVSLAEDPPGSITFDVPDGVNGTFSAEGQLLAPAVDEAVAQENAEAAQAAIATAIAGVSGVTVTIQEEDGHFVFSLLQ